MQFYKSVYLILFILLSCHFNIRGQGYFSISTDSVNRAYTGFEVIQEIPFKLHNSTNIFKEFKWIRTDMCPLPSGWSALVCDCNTCWTGAEYTNPVNSGVVSACDLTFRYMFDFNAVMGQHTTKLAIYNPIDSSNSATNILFTINSVCFPNQLLGLNKLTSIIYPSPCGEYIQIQIPVSLAPVQLSIFNLLGSLVQEKILVNEESVKLSTSNLSTGIYIMKLIDTYSGAASILKFEKK